MLDTSSAIGIDIGGTNLRAARVSGAGAILERVSERIDREADAAVRRIVELVHQLDRPEVTAIGIGVPGRVDARRRAVLSGGYLNLAGRRSEMIKSAGERLFPAEIEEVLAKHNGVREVAVIGAPDELLGERVVALVVAAPGLDPAELRSHCLRWLPFVRTPREIRLVEAMPKTSTGKIDRRRLLPLLESLRKEAHPNKA